MTSRRKFLLNGSMATTALLTARPFKTFANVLAPVTSFNINNNKVIFVHTGNYTNSNHHQTHRGTLAHTGQWCPSILTFLLALPNAQDSLRMLQILPELA